MGDSAITVDFGNSISEEVNKKVLHLFRALKNTALPFFIDIVPAYSSLTVHYDVPALFRKKEEGKTVFDMVAEIIERLPIRQPEDEVPSRLIKVPVCYTGIHAPDIHKFSDKTGLTENEVVSLHCSGKYRVYMLGFLPGFTYMGEVDEIISYPRKTAPEPVEPGAIGIAGRQTGIYPMQSPGGWQIIGRTPLKIFDATSENPVYFRPGDEVEFYPITEDEFTNYQTRTS